MYVFCAGSVGVWAIAFSENSSGISTRAKPLNLRCECAIKYPTSSPSVFRDFSSIVLDARPDPRNHTKLHKKKLCKSQLRNSAKSLTLETLNVEVICAVPFVLDVAHD